MEEKKVVCPECANDIELEKPTYEVGDIISCPICGSDLEVASIKEDGELELLVIEEEK